MTTMNFDRHPIGPADAIIRYIGSDWPKVSWSWTWHDDGVTYTINEWLNAANTSIEQPSQTLIDSIYDDIKEEQILHFIRKERQIRLDEADKFVIKDLTTTGSVSQELKDYMQELRDMPDKWLNGEITASVNQSDSLNIHLVCNDWPQKPF